MTKIHKTLLDAFSRSYDPPHWIIEKLQASEDNEVRSAIMSALDAVPAGATNELDDETHAKLDIVFQSRDRDERVRLHVVCSAVARAMHQARIESVSTTANSRSKPYDHPILADIPVDKDGLVPLAAFELKGDALCYKGHAFFVLQALPSSNANYWLLQNIVRHDLVDSMSIRLDPLLHGPEDELAGHFYRMDVYGRPLDWDRIRLLREVEHGRWMPGKLSTKSLFTDYAWVPHADEVDFLCEEVPPVAEVEDRSARYLHAVFNKQKNCLTHLDGAIRFYTLADLEKREKEHVRNAGKVGRRVKVFRTDHPVSPDTMSDIVQAFFVWNYDVARYFGAPIPNDF
jgi:hypothetical protein